MRSKTFFFKTFILLFLIVGLTTFINITVSCASDITLNNTQTQICFSPGGGCTEAIVNEISRAKSEILIQAYSFTSAPIAKALVNAYKKGIHVEIILDKSNNSETYSVGDFFRRTVRSDDDLFAVIMQHIKGMKKFFLG